MRAVGVRRVGAALAVVMVLLALAPVGRAGAQPVDPLPPAPGMTDPPPGFVPLPPARLLDTRAGMSTVDGVAAGGGAVGPGVVRTVPVLGRAGVPAAGVSAVVLNLTATGATDGSYVTLYPAAEAPPTASNLNLRPGQTVANLSVARVGAGGAVALRNFVGSVDLIADVAGYIRSASTGIAPLSPGRVLDTRAGGVTVDGAASGGGAVAPGPPLLLDVRGRAGVPATGVGAVILNLTATNASTDTFVTVHPSGEPPPTASTLNLGPWSIVPNLVLARLGADGRIAIANAAGTVDVLADVVGWVAAGSTELTALRPARLADTRLNGPTIDGAQSGTGPLASGQDGMPGQQEHSVLVVGRGGVPATGVGAVVLNVTVTAPTLETYVTVHPRGRARPVASNLNVAAGRTTANLVVARPGADGRVAFYNHAGITHLVVDVVGWLPVVPTVGRVKSWGCPEFDFDFCTSLPPDIAPVAVEGGTSPSEVTDIATGWYHSLALRADGSVIAWGNNFGGSLGNPLVAASSTPVPVPGFGPGSGVIAIAAGDLSSYALKADGSVWQWGLDVKTVRGQRLFQRVPQPVAPFGPGQGVTDIFAGGNSAAVLIGGDVLWLWGAMAPNVVPEPQVAGVERVALGHDHVLGLFDDGRVGAMGDNTHGQLGVPAAGASAPTMRVPTGLSAGVVDVAVGLKTSYAVKADGSVLAWGANNQGVLGVGSTSPKVTEPTVVVGLGAGSGVDDVAAGFAHALVRRADGSVTAWGFSGHGEVGSGVAGPGIIVTTPVTVTGLGPGSGVRRLAAAGPHSLALT